MSEIQIPKIEKQDIQAPQIEPGGSAIVLQRHERYDRHRDTETAGSIFPEHAAAAFDRDVEFFQDVLDQEAADGAETMVLFVSSDTQYAGKGRRSMETGQLAQDAAKEVFEKAGIDPKSRIINIHEGFNTDRHEPTDQDIRRVRQLVEPDIFEPHMRPYVDHLITKHGPEDGPGTGMSPDAWAAHESDAEKDVREQYGAEGIGDLLARTKKGVRILERYAQAFHANNPGKRLVVWATTHYDTISPLVKDAAGMSLGDYLPVDYGGGVVIDVPPSGEGAHLNAQSQRVALHAGRATTDQTLKAS